ncbi:MAG: phenylacetate-CoA oxygenase subunit PaaC [Parvularculaceae bacterium]|nr:phenylacetate-CoA oxygenase subunit PaaC [Parvularculaceae bacterium]
MALFELALRMGDNDIVLAQRISAWCGHAPILEEDIALANVALDLIGQTKLWLDLAGEIEGAGRSADDLAFLRDARAYKNALLVERPNGDFAYTLMRQFLFDAWHLPMLRALKSSSEQRVADIAEKAEKEARYHLERTEDLIIRLGDGTQESHSRMQAALDDLYPFAGEFVAPDAIDDELASRKIAPALSEIGALYFDYLETALAEATLKAPVDAPVRKGGRKGLHSEELGYLLAEMQFLQRAYPGAKW